MKTDFINRHAKIGLYVAHDVHPFRSAIANILLLLGRIFAIFNIRWLFSFRSSLGQQISNDKIFLTIIYAEVLNFFNQILFGIRNNMLDSFHSRLITKLLNTDPSNLTSKITWPVQNEKTVLMTHLARLCNFIASCAFASDINTSCK